MCRVETFLGIIPNMKTKIANPFVTILREVMKM